MRCTGSDRVIYLGLADVCPSAVAVDDGERVYEVSDVARGLFRTWSYSERWPRMRQRGGR